jgi:hypothetical protein
MYIPPLGEYLGVALGFLIGWLLVDIVRYVWRRFRNKK